MEGRKSAPDLTLCVCGAPIAEGEWICSACGRIGRERGAELQPSARRAKPSSGLMFLMSVVVVALLVVWLFLWFAHGVQENCDPNCVTGDQVAALGAAFLVALMLRIALWVARRRR
jgi:hypothetical protein